MKYDDAEYHCPLKFTNSILLSLLLSLSDHKKKKEVIINAVESLPRSKLIVFEILKFDPMRVFIAVL